MSSAHEFFVREQVRQHLAEIRAAVGGLHDSAGRYGLALSSADRRAIAKACDELERAGEEIADTFGEIFPAE